MDTNIGLTRMFQNAMGQLAYPSIVIATNLQSGRLKIKGYMMKNFLCSEPDQWLAAFWIHHLLKVFDPLECFSPALFILEREQQ